MDNDKLQKRPTLTDPKEFAIVRSMYFDSTDYFSPDRNLPQDEINDRMNHRPNRNQSR